MQDLTHDDLEWTTALAHSMAGASDGDDVAQEALLVANAEGRRDRGWLFGVVRNRSRMLARSASRRRKRQARFAEPGDQRGADQELASSAALQTLARAVGSLTPAEQQLLRLRFEEDNNAAEIAARLGVRPSSIRSRLGRLLAKLRAMVQSEWDAPTPWHLAVLGAGPSPLSATLIGVGLTTAALVSGLVVLAAVRSNPEPRRVQTVPTVQASRDSSRPAAKRRVPATNAPAAGRREILAALLATRATRLSKTRPRHGAEPDAVDDAADDLRMLFFADAQAAIKPLLDALSTQASASLKACAQQSDRAQGVLRIRARIVAEPDVGVLVESLEIKEDTVGDPELLECVEAMVYGFSFPDPTGSVFKSHDFTVDMQTRQVVAAGVVPLDLSGDVFERYPAFLDALPTVLERIPGLRAPLAQVLAADETLRERIPGFVRVLEETASAH